MTLPAPWYSRMETYLPLAGRLYNSILVGNPRSPCSCFSDPVLDVWPQSFANALEVTVSVRKYVAWANLYPSGWVQISGAAYPSTGLTFRKETTMVYETTDARDAQSLATARQCLTSA